MATDLQGREGKLTGPTQEMVDRAAQHLMDDLARLDALPAHEHAAAALPYGTDAERAAWIRKWRPESLGVVPPDEA